jgi:hypothetical protein
VIDGPIEGGAVYGALRTYTLQLYQEIGFPAPLKGGQDKKLVGYFQSDTGTINQLLQLWKFDDHADRRAYWAGLSANGFRRGLHLKVSPPAYDPGGKATPGGTVGTAEFAIGPPSPEARALAGGQPSDDPRHPQPCPFQARA